MLPWSRWRAVVPFLAFAVSGCALTHEPRPGHGGDGGPDTPVVTPSTPGRDIVAGGIVSRSPRYRVVHTTGQSTINVVPSQSARFRIQGGLIPVSSQGGSQ
jgi:hypothetical protein